MAKDDRSRKLTPAEARRNALFLEKKAALEAQGLTGEELLLVYLDSGGDTVSADWAAAGSASGEA